MSNSNTTAAHMHHFKADPQTGIRTCIDCGFVSAYLAPSTATSVSTASTNDDCPARKTKGPHSWMNSRTPGYKKCILCSVHELDTPPSSAPSAVKPPPLPSPHNFTTTKWNWGPPIDPGSTTHWAVAPYQEPDRGPVPLNGPPSAKTTPPRPTCSGCNKELSAYLDAYYGTDKTQARKCTGCRS
jgi:hypothetical protein